MKRTFLSGVLACVALTGPAIADEARKPSANPCPIIRSIDNFKPVDNHSAILETSPARRYLVTFVNSCRELKWAWSARVESRPGICLRPGDVIVTGRHGFVERCFIRSIAQLPPKNGAAPASY